MAEEHKLFKRNQREKGNSETFIGKVFSQRKVKEGGSFE
ncbi:hypothetical protein FH5_00004 [Priestia endophytica]|nr:hypothetical protein FH5_00004 [Priestia endophytica]